MDRGEIVSQFEKQSTWRLLLLYQITLGIYGAHYMRRQTAVFNEYLDRDGQISRGLIYAILLLVYLRVMLGVPLILSEDVEAYAVFNLLDIAYCLLQMMWGYQTRNRMNMLFGATRDQSCWFHGLWSTLLTPFYFNFKINRLNQQFPKEGSALGAEA